MACSITHPSKVAVGMLDCVASLCWKLKVQVLSATIVKVHLMLMQMADCHGIAV